MPREDSSEQPSALWRGASTATTTAVGSIVRFFLFGGLCNYEIHGLDTFLKVLEPRWDIKGRERGLITGALSFWLMRIAIAS